MEQIIQKNVTSQYKENMAIYAVETNMRRAFPDWKDGFKLCHRRIIYAMANDLPCKTKLTKTAMAVGRIIGAYHPHGDSSVADAIKPLCNWFETNVPLLYSESNMGSMQGDSAAAPRYTEVMLNKFSLDVILADLLEAPEVVDWVDNYSGDCKEPEYLPVALPLLLINGSYGIGVGKTVSIPPHNITEVIDATLALLDNPNSEVVLVPDMCMKCQLIDNNWKQISNTGMGTFKVRAILDIETFNKGKATEHEAVVIKSTPLRGWLDKGNAENGGIKYTILKLVEDGKLPQITKIDEDSHDTDMRMVIHLKPGSDPNYVREFLYKNTKLQDTISVNFEVLDGINMVRFSYKSYLEAFINQRKITKARLYSIKLQDIKTKYHERDAYVKALESGQIDNIIAKIRKSKINNDTENIEWLIKLLKITDLQAKFILQSSIKSLSIAHLEKYKADAKMLLEKEQMYVNKIINEDMIVDDIRQELLSFRQKYSKPRNCTIITQSQISNIPQGEFNIVITENTFIKKLTVNEQVGAFRGDNPIQIMKVDNTKDIILVTAHGRMFKLPVSKIPLTGKNSMGNDIRILVKGITSNVIKMLYQPEVEALSKQLNNPSAIIVTEGNYIKKLDLQDLLIATPSGIILTKLKDKDVIRDIQFVEKDSLITLYSGKKALTFKESNVACYKRNAIGVNAMDTSTTIDGMTISNSLDVTSKYVIVITSAGKINKISMTALPISNRYKSGSAVIRLSKTESIFSIVTATDDNKLSVTTKLGNVEIPVNDIKVQSSVSSGIKLIPLKDDSLVKVKVV